MEIKWKEYRTFCEVVYYVGTISSIIGSKIIAEITYGKEWKAQMYHTLHASDKLNKEMKHVTFENAKKWCQEEIDKW